MADSPRKAKLNITYKSEDESKKISDYVTSFTYNDVASGQADSINLSLDNIDKDWIRAMLPTKGDTIKANIKTFNWNEQGDSKTFKCGNFTIDDISFAGRPLTCDIGAITTPANIGFKATLKTKMWTKATIKEIAEQIAKEANLKLVYEAGTINIAEAEQNAASNSEFLSSLCSDYGLAMKIYSSKIVIYDEEVYEQKEKVCTIKENQMLSWSYNTTLDGTYTGARISYTIPNSKKTVTVIVGTDERLLEVKTKVDNQYDAEMKAAAKVNGENKKATTMTVKIMADTRIIAGSVVEIKGLYKLNGKYFVDKVAHSLGSGYTMTLTLRLIQDRIKAKSKQEAKAQEQGQKQATKAQGQEQTADKAFISEQYEALVYESGQKIFRHTISKY